MQVEKSEHRGRRRVSALGWSEVQLTSIGLLTAAGLARAAKNPQNPSNKKTNSTLTAWSTCVG